MKIQDPNLSSLGGAGGAAGAGGASGPGRAGAPDQARNRGSLNSLRSERTEDGDHLQLSGLSQSLSSAELDSPERLDRIDELRELVRSGQYQPDALEVSKSIIRDAFGNVPPVSGDAS